MATTNEDSYALVRLALACEASKRPVRREELISLVFGGGPRRPLKVLLSEANERLAADFAMQLVPLPATSRPPSTATVAGRKAASVTTKQSKEPSGSSYILVAKGKRTPGLAYHRHPEQLAYLMVILCLIALNGGEMEEEMLREKLASLSPTPPGLGERINEWRRQRYLTVGRRIDDQAINVYSAGPRAVLEFPPEHLVGFIVDLFTKTNGVDEEERTILAARLKMTLQVNSTTAATEEDDPVNDANDDGEGELL